MRARRSVAEQGIQQLRWLLRAVAVRVTVSSASIVPVLQRWRSRPVAVKVVPLFHWTQHSCSGAAVQACRASAVGAHAATSYRHRP
jgi:hypothetical protein